MPVLVLCLIVSIFLANTVSLWGQTAPKGYTVPLTTLSPDQHFGVTVPNHDDDDKIKDPRNSVIETKTGRMLGPIQTEYVAFSHINNGEIIPTLWSADNSTLLWQVDGKWGFDTEVLVKLADRKIAWQVDVLKTIREEILKRTSAAAPKGYVAVKQGHKDWGSWYKDGFAVDSVLDNSSSPLRFPLVYHVFLTSDTKGGDDIPDVDSRMTAEVKEDGTVKVKEFHLGKNPPAREW